MGSLHAFFVAHWDQEPEIRKIFGIKPSVFRFLENVHVIFGAHWDPEPRRVRSAGFRACGFGRLSSRPFLVHRTRKSGKPAGWKACATSRFMGRSAAASRGEAVMAAAGFNQVSIRNPQVVGGLNAALL